MNKQIDPVCGMTVDPATAAGQYEHAGQTYYFCSTHCLHKFSADPAAYLNKAPQLPALPMTQLVGKAKALPQAAAPTGTKYVCPMDPEIVRDKPGACPKCGMALEPELPAAPLTKIEYTCPMHPEIVRDEPGNCPICGMALEPRTVTLEEAPNPELTDMTRRF